MRAIETGDAQSLRARLAGGETVHGAFQRIPHPQLTELVGFAGFDFVVLDTEHTPVSLERIADLVRAADAAALPSLVRLPACDARAVAQALETSCAGIHVPVVRNAVEAASIVAATRYPPRGTRGLAMPRRSGYGMHTSAAEWVAASEGGVLVVAQIEDAAGVEAAAAIAAVDGVDVLFVGLTDLSLDLGLPGQREHPRLRDAVERVIDAARGEGKAAGFPVGSAEAVRELQARGASYFTCDEVGLLAGAARAFLAAVRSPD